MGPATAALAPSIGLCYVSPMAWLKGSLSAVYIALNTAVVCALLYPMAALRLLLTGTWRSTLTQRMDPHHRPVGKRQQRPHQSLGADRHSSGVAIAAVAPRPLVHGGEQPSDLDRHHIAAIGAASGTSAAEVLYQARAHLAAAGGAWP